MRLRSTTKSTKPRIRGNAYDATLCFRLESTPMSISHSLTAAPMTSATSIRNWELSAPASGMQVTVPALHIAGDRDLVLSFGGMDQVIANLSKFVPQLRSASI